MSDEELQAIFKAALADSLEAALRAVYEAGRRDPV